MTTQSQYYRIFIFIFVISNFMVFGQTPDQIKKILQKTDIEKLDSLKSTVSIRSEALKQKAIAQAKMTDQPIFIDNIDGSFDELMGIYEDGSLYYYGIDNMDAAKSTRTNHLNAGGSLGLNLNGQDMLGGVWDGGAARISHNEFGGRVSIGDDATELNNNSFHMTHVAGTIAAKGLEFGTKGMANQSILRTFDWNNDTQEVINEITTNGLLLSNHSYGTRASQSPSWLIGAYSTEASIWDEVAYAAPYYLMVTSAGNEGNFFNDAATTPFYDKLTTNKNAKNNLVIANAQDAFVTNNGNLIFVEIAGSSSQGPTDDNRIKPDIAGNGIGLYSTSSANDSSYATLSGTSMSGPNVMGTLLLLQQYHNQLYNNFMWSSTLKGLACHTADDAGNEGPDVNFGWGLLNAKKAAETLAENGLSSWVSEEILSQNETFTFTVQAIGNEPLIASITWTDVAGEPINGQLNNPTPVLVNDLDIRVSNANNIFFPWKLTADASLPAIRTEDNIVDNVEQIKIDNPLPGEYTITVTHKGNLVNNKQDFSLVVTGISSSFALRTKGNNYVICNNETLSIPFDFITNTTDNVTFEAVNLPENMDANFSIPASNTNASVSLILSNFDNVAAGDYEIGISASNGVETEVRYIRIKMYSTFFNPVIYNTPTNGQSAVGNASIFSWEADINAENYTFQLSSTPAFDNIIFEQLTTENSFIYAALMSETIYYWRVVPENRCGILQETNFASFQTGSSLCGLEFIPTDYTDAVIGEVANSVATIPVVVNQNINISNIVVQLDVTHSWVQDLTVYLEGPAEIGSPTITLMQEVCGGDNDFNVTYSDAGGAIVCMNNPAVFGEILPLEALSNFSNLPAQGTWNIIVVDNYSQDGGIINSASLIFCDVSPLASNIELINNQIITSIAADKIIEDNELLTTSQMDTNTEHIYTLVGLPSEGQLLKNDSILSLGSIFTQSDINEGNVVYTNNLTEASADSFVVNIINSSQSWLPNQTINIVINETLGFENFEHQEIKVYPNPSSGIVYIQSSSFWQDAKIIITDITGRKMMKSTLSTDELAIDLLRLSEGMYLISIEKEAQKSTFKILIKR